MEGIRQVKEILEPLGMEVIVVPMTGYALHIDGAFTMVDVDKALVNVTKLPYFFLQKLKELGIEMIDVHPARRLVLLQLPTVKTRQDHDVHRHRPHRRAAHRPRHRSYPDPL